MNSSNRNDATWAVSTAFYLSAVAAGAMGYHLCASSGHTCIVSSNNRQQQKSKDDDPATTKEDETTRDLLLQEKQGTDNKIKEPEKSVNESTNSAKKDPLPDNSCIYMDYNGTTPVYPEVLEAMMPYLTEHFGNPSSGHVYGVIPKKAMNQARRQLLELVGANIAFRSENNNNQTLLEESIWFTSCGTESDNLAIRLACLSTPHIKKKHIVTTNVEHPAILNCLRALIDEGLLDSYTAVPVDTDGRVATKDVVDAIQDGKTILVTVMLANNESGSLQPVSEIATACRGRGVLCHSDAAQAVGKVSVNILDDLVGPVDMMSIVGHKMGAPKGIAALYIRPNCLQEEGRILPKRGILLQGGGQEYGFRGGSENVAYMVGMGQAAVLAKTRLKENQKHLETCRARLLDQLVQALGKDVVRVNGPENPQQRLPNTLSVGFRNVNGVELLAGMHDSVAASAGATCHSAASVSAVLQAMKVPLEYARGTLRLSLGPKTTLEQVDKAAAIIIQHVRKQLSEKNGGNDTKR